MGPTWVPLGSHFGSHLGPIWVPFGSHLGPTWVPLCVPFYSVWVPFGIFNSKFSGTVWGTVWATLSLHLWVSRLGDTLDSSVNARAAPNPTSSSPLVVSPVAVFG